MAFIQRAAKRSLRDGVRCLRAASRRLYHLGLKNVARSTVAVANTSQPVGFFRDLFAEMLICAPQRPPNTNSASSPGCSAWTRPPIRRPVALSLGLLSQDQGRNQIACAAGSRRPYPGLCCHYRYPGPRKPHRQNAGAAQALYCGF